MHPEGEQALPSTVFKWYWPVVKGESHHDLMIRYDESFSIDGWSLQMVFHSAIPPAEIPESSPEMPPECQVIGGVFEFGNKLYMVTHMRWVLDSKDSTGYRIITANSLSHPEALRIQEVMKKANESISGTNKTA